MGASCLAASTSRSSSVAREAAYRPSGHEARAIRTPAPLAARTTATTSLRRRTASARSVDITTRCAPVSGSRSSPMPGVSPRSTPSCARQIRCRSLICAPTAIASPKPRLRPSSVTRSSRGRRVSSDARANSPSWTSPSWAAPWAAPSARSSGAPASTRPMRRSRSSASRRPAAHACRREFSRSCRCRKPSARSTCCARRAVPSFP